MTDLEKIEMNVEGFWTRLDEMQADLEALDYEVLEANMEYIVVADLQDEEKQYQLFLGHTLSTIWVQRVREI